MATSIRAASIARDVAELMKANRRSAGAIAASQVPLPAKDRLVIATSGQPATWQLSALPYLGDLGSSLNLSLNGLELDEATDYSVDYTTGVVTFSADQQTLFKATPTPADVLTADYLTSDDLIAQAQPGDTGVLNTLVDFSATGWKYVQTTWSDNTDYSSATFNDSGWSTGQAAFGSGTGPTAVNTTWPIHGRIWIRRTIPTAVTEMQVTLHVDNFAWIYVNGTLAVDPTLTQGSDGGGGVLTHGPFAIDATLLNPSGNNVIAIKCDDDNSASSGDVSLIDAKFEGR